MEPACRNVRHGSGIVGGGHTLCMLFTRRQPCRFSIPPNKNPAMQKMAEAGFMIPSMTQRVTVNTSANANDQLHRQAEAEASVNRLWLTVALKLVLTIGAVLLSVSRHFPLETLIIAVVLVLYGIVIILYIGELLIIGWAVDFFSKIEESKTATPVPLEHESRGDIIIVKLRGNIATVGQCRSVREQLQRLIDEHHCDFVIDFAYAERISRRFRGVMVRFSQAARKEAEELGKPFRPVALPRGEVFKVFDNRQRAVEEMSRHGGHGWVALCCVPFGIRAVSELTEPANRPGPAVAAGSAPWEPCAAGGDAAEKSLG